MRTATTATMSTVTAMRVSYHPLVNTINESLPLTQRTRPRAHHLVPEPSFVGYYYGWICILSFLGMAATSSVTGYSMILPTASTQLPSLPRPGRRTATTAATWVLHLSTPTNPGNNNNNNNIIEDDEDAKIFAALSSSSSTPTTSPIIDEEEMIITNTDATYTGSVDWDAEWKAVMKKEGSGSAGAGLRSSLSSFIPQNKKNKTSRPGSDFYKSEAEIAAIRAANEVTKKATKLASNVASSTSSLTDWNTIKYDWKIWIGILVLLSFGTAFLTAVPQSDPIANTESYFV